MAGSADQETLTAIVHHLAREHPDRLRKRVASRSTGHHRNPAPIVQFDYAFRNS
jgi:hypothetical protein